MNKVISVENISKRYRLGLVNSGTIRDDVMRWWYLIRGKEDPLLNVGEVNDRTSTSNSDYVLSLNDVNFDVKQGEILGIIGRNGAGKSTLLKLLSKVTAPTKGVIKTKGRIASLLEVGTGFHPELTGKENIYLNGAILGMRKSEITEKLDEIIAFAGIERYSDTPVKRYSSGMYVRLAFAVAAHLESEILIIDEVLAVGDSEFQKKCLGKIGDLSKGGGRTVLFVSHNMTAVSSLCTRVLVLKDGSIDFNGAVGAGIDHYLDMVEHNSGFTDLRDKKSDLWTCSQELSKLISIETLDEDDTRRTSFKMGSKVRLKLEIEIKEQFSKLDVGVFVTGHKENITGLMLSSAEDFHFSKKGIVEIIVEVEQLKLFPGTYTLGVWVSDGEKIDDAYEHAIDIEVTSFPFTPGVAYFDRFKGYGELIRSTWKENTQED